MAYRIDISPSALLDAEEAYLRAAEQSPSRANTWYNGLFEAIFSLETMPTRCPLAPESEEIGRELRQLLYGKPGRIYRIVFALVYDEATEEEVIRVYRIWHGARDRLKAEELEPAEEAEEEG